MQIFLPSEIKSHRTIMNIPIQGGCYKRIDNFPLSHKVDKRNRNSCIKVEAMEAIVLILVYWL